jgi:hypothetical protein
MTVEILSVLQNAYNIAKHDNIKRLEIFFCKYPKIQEVALSTIDAIENAQSSHEVANFGLILRVLCSHDRINKKHLIKNIYFKALERCRSSLKATIIKVYYQAILILITPLLDSKSALRLINLLNYIILHAPSEMSDCSRDDLIKTMINLAQKYSSYLGFDEIDELAKVLGKTDDPTDIESLANLFIRLIEKEKKINYPFTQLIEAIFIADRTPGREKLLSLVENLLPKTDQKQRSSFLRTIEDLSKRFTIPIDIQEQLKTLIFPDHIVSKVTIDNITYYIMIDGSVQEHSLT